MISYDTYQNKIKRLAAVKNFIVRFRVLFIALFTAITAFILAFIFIKGMITQDIILPEKIVYGDDYALAIQPPEALFSDAKYQFRTVSDGGGAKSAVKRNASAELGEEDGWTYELPTRAGDYLVRVVTEKTFGVSYSEPKPFRIEKFETKLEITADSVVYGGTLGSDQYTFELVNGDRLITTGLELGYLDTDTEFDVADIYANSDSVVILNKSNEDVTDCYDIITPVKENVKLSVNTELVIIRPDVADTGYNGAEFIYDNEVVSSMKGVTPSVETRIYSAGVSVTGNPVNAGTYTVVIIPEKTRILNGNGVDVTKYYPNISHEEASFAITPRFVTLTTADDTKVYDGTALVNSTVTYEGLVDGHKTDSAYVGEAAVNVKEGGYLNEYACTVTDAKGADVTANYRFVTSYGKLTILHRNVVVTTASDTKVYDGTPLVNENYEQVGLLDGHKLAGVYAGIEPAINVGRFANIYVYTVTDENGNDVTSNYLFANDGCFGTLEITQREICITSATDSWIYDGKAHSNRETSVALADESVQGDPVIYGEEIKVIQSTSVIFFTEEAVENVIGCSIFKDGKDITTNYKISYKNGALSITKRDITITSPTVEKVYDGTPLAGNSASPEVEGIADTDICRPVSTVSQTDAGTCPNTTEYRIYLIDETDIASPQSEPIYPLPPLIEKDVTENYNITPVYGTLTVTKRGITIYTSSPEKVYDGTPLSGDSAQPALDGVLADGHVLVPVSTVSRTEAGTLTNDTKYIIGYEEYPESGDYGSVFVETTENYSVSYGENGVITVKQRPIMISTAYEEREYNGKALTKTEDWQILSIDNLNWFDLLDEHTLEVDDSSVAPASITDVGSILNTVIYKVVCNGKNITENYKLSYTYENYLVVRARPITLITASDEWTYNGGAFSNPAVTVVYGYAFDDGVEYPINAEESETDEVKPLVLDHKLELEYERFVTNAGKHSNDCRYDIVNEAGESLHKNYAVFGKYGTLTVKPRPVTITTADGNRVYDDTPYENVFAKAEEFNEEAECGIITNHEIVHDATQFTASVTYVTEGQVENNLYYRIYVKDLPRTDENDVTANYAIKYVYGKIYVTKRAISVTTATRSWEFDGNSHAARDYTITEGSLVDGYRLIAVSETRVQFVTEGEVENRVKYGVYVNGDVRLIDLTENYEITYTYGKISCTVRYVKVETATRSWIYDGEAHGDTSYEDLHIKNVTFNEDGSIAGYDVDESEKGLVLDHTLVAQKYNTVTNHSEIVKNEIDYIVVDEDINENYRLVVEAGTLTIDRRPLTITTADGNRVYDDTPYKNVSAEAERFNEENESGIVEGHKIVHDETRFTASVTYVKEGKITNELHYLVFDATDSDVTDNYDIDAYYVYGEIFVTPRPLTISTAVKDREYNGEPFSWTADFVVEEFNKDTDSGIVSGHEAKLNPDSDIASVTYVHEGIVENRLLFIITCGSEDLTANYNLDDYYEYGTLHITPYGITVTNSVLSKVYDGTPLLGDEGVQYDQLIDGDTLLSDKVASITDVGTVINDTSYVIKNSEGEVITDSYKITYIDGELTVTANTLAITTAKLEKVYDGTPLYGEATMNDGADDLKVISELKAEGLVDGDYIKVDEATVASPIDVIAGEENITHYLVYTVRDGEEIDVTANYGGSNAIDYVYGTLTVTKRQITIATATDEREFDGTLFSNTSVKDNKITFGSLAVGQELYVADGAKFASITYKGSVENEIDFSIRWIDGNDVTENYAITYYAGGGAEYGTLTVTARQISFTTAYRSWEYDGGEKFDTGHTEPVHSSGKPALVLDHYLNPTSYVKIAEAGEIDNAVEYEVLDSEGNDVSENYALTVNYGKLSVTPVKLVIQLNEVENSVYGEKFNGYPADEATFSYLSGATVNGEILVVAIQYRLNGAYIENPVNAGTYDVVADWNNTYVKNGYANLNNYEITVNETSFIIEKRAVTVELLEAGRKTYDAVAYEFPVELDKAYKLATGSSLAEGDKLTIAVKYLYESASGLVYVDAPIDAGSYIIEFDADNCIVNGEYPASENYEISCVNNVTDNAIIYVIDRRQLFYRLNDVTHVYLGIVSYSFEDDFDESQLLANDHLTVSGKTVQEDGTAIDAVNVGVYDIVVSGYTVTHKENAVETDVTNNYELITPDATAKLTITPREIDVRVWFEDTASDYSSREYSGDAIDLKEEFPDNGPYTSTSDQATDEFNWGIYYGDLKKINTVFTSSDELVELGIYTVSVTLENADGTADEDGVLKNYLVKNYIDGTFEITLRQVNVTALKSDGQLEYDGSTVGEVGLKWFDYDTSHNGNYGEAGFFEAEDKNDYEAIFSLYRMDSDVLVSSDTVLQAGEYYLAVTLRYIGAEGEEKYAIVNEYQSEPFTVNKRVIYAVTPDVLPADGTEFVYNKIAVSDPESYTTYRYVDGILTEGGFVTENGDGDYAIPVFEYVNKNGNSYQSAVHAGEYTIRIVRFEGINGEVIIEDNYEVADFPYNESNAPRYGTLEIKREIIIVVPTEYKEVKYDGTVTEISLPEDHYDVLYGTLYEGDSLSFKPSGSVNINKTYIAMVRFNSLTIDSGDGVTDDYEIFYNYTALKKKYPELALQFTSDKFVAELSFVQREVHISQFAPPEQYREVQFGTNVKIYLDDPVIQDKYILDTGDGLLSGHRVEISSAGVFALDLEPVKEWILMCKVYDAQGKEITNGYNVIIDNEDETLYGDTYIKVVPKKINIDVIRPLDTLAEGETVDPSLYTVKGSFVFGEALEVKVENGKLVAYITARTGESNNHFYNVTFTYPGMGIIENSEKEAEYVSRI